MKKDKPAQSETKKGLPHEAKGLFILTGSLILLLSLISFQNGIVKANYLGLIGYSLAIGLEYLFGYGAYLFIGFFVWLGWKLVYADMPQNIIQKGTYFSLNALCLCMLFNLYADTNILQNPIIQSHIYSTTSLTPYGHETVRYYLGGAPLYHLYKDLPFVNLRGLLSNIGVGLIFSLGATVTFLLFIELKVKTIVSALKAFFVHINTSFIKLLRHIKAKRNKKRVTPIVESHARFRREQTIETKPIPISTLNELLHSQSEESGELPQESVHEEESSFDEDQIHIAKEEQFKLKEKKAYAPEKKATSIEYKKYKLPSFMNLSSAKKVDQPTLKRDLQRQAAILEETLQSFGIEAKVGQINCGPTITSFEVHPPVGVKVQKIKVLENDIALNLQAKTIRIIAPIPGKAAVGIEIPSLFPQAVGFKEMLTKYLRSEKRLEIPIFLGKTVSGDDVVCDLTKMPHCIIAGATGSGKSVCINSIVLSILMTARPDEVKLLLIDPKKVELSGYTRLPHMIAPVITEAHGSYAALQWLVKEMQRRYELLKYLGLRNIKSFNKRKKDQLMENAHHEEIPDKMSYIVAIIDEFADLMMASSSDLETPIARIAQMARAVGIHLILATQRPSREVITGLIKANFPCRISFKVSSRVNSQIILDENGAETLLGNGDLLFLPPGTSSLVRAQGAFISDEDINRVIGKISMQASPNYLIESFDNMAFEDASSSSKPRDDLFEKALLTVANSKNASTTFLQRKLKIGYARAASLMDELEERNIIGPQEGSKPRQVYPENALAAKLALEKNEY